MSSAGAGLQETPAAVGCPSTRAWALRLWAAARGGLRTQVVAAVGLAPLTLALFQQVSLVGFLANLVAIPVVTLLVTPLALLGTLLALLLELAAWITQGLVALLAWLVSWPQSVWSGAAAPPWAEGAALVAALLLVLPVPWRIRLLAVPLALPLLLPARALPAAGESPSSPSTSGRAAPCSCARATICSSTTPGRATRATATPASAVPPPLLRALGETRIDELALSHRDTDHVGGAQALVAILPPAQLRSSLIPAPSLGRPAARARAALRGWPALDVGTASPSTFRGRQPPSTSGRASPTRRRACCASRAAARACCSPATSRRRRSAPSSRPTGRRCAVTCWVVPHHGSKTSSSAVFLDVVRPRLAVVQAGYRNRFGHPAEEVLQRYRERGIALRMTPDRGAWQWLASDAPEEELLAARLAARPAPSRYLRPVIGSASGPQRAGICYPASQGAEVGAGTVMRPSFDEMQASADTVREHYAGYARWLALQSAVAMRAQREEAEMIFRRVGTDVRRLRREGRRRGRDRAADHPVRLDPAHDPGARVGARWSVDCASA